MTVRHTRIEGRVLDRINEDEIARRKRASMATRLLGGFVIMFALGTVGMFIGGTFCSAALIVIGCVVAGALVAPLLGGAP